MFETLLKDHHFSHYIDLRDAAKAHMNLFCKKMTRGVILTAIACFFLSLFINFALFAQIDGLFLILFLPSLLSLAIIYMIFLINAELYPGLPNQFEKTDGKAGRLFFILMNKQKHDMFFNFKYQWINEIKEEEFIQMIKEINEAIEGYVLQEADSKQLQKSLEYAKQAWVNRQKKNVIEELVKCYFIAKRYSINEQTQSSAMKNKHHLQNEAEKEIGIGKIL